MPFLSAIIPLSNRDCSPPHRSLGLTLTVSPLAILSSKGVPYGSFSQSCAHDCSQRLDARAVSCTDQRGPCAALCPLSESGERRRLERCLPGRRWEPGACPGYARRLWLYQQSPGSAHYRSHAGGAMERLDDAARRGWPDLRGWLLRHFEFCGHAARVCPARNGRERSLGLDLVG